MPNTQPNKPTILDLIKDVQQGEQTPEFRQQMHDRIQSRVAEEEQKRRTGLDYFLRKVLVAVPVVASLAVVFTLVYLVTAGPTVPDTTPLVKQSSRTAIVPVDSAKAPINDPELQEIIALAFAFEAETSNDDSKDSTIKTASSAEADMILAYLRE